MPHFSIQVLIHRNLVLALAQMCIRPTLIMWSLLMTIKIPLMITLKCIALANLRLTVIIATLAGKL